MSSLSWSALFCSSSCRILSRSSFSVGIRLLWHCAQCLTPSLHLQFRFLRNGTVDVPFDFRAQLADLFFPESAIRLRVRPGAAGGLPPGQSFAHLSTHAAPDSNRHSECGPGAPRASTAVRPLVKNRSHSCRTGQALG